jgi:hypothetical protein
MKMPQTIRIDASPHPGQAEVQKHPARFKVLASGRRWGKTRLGVNLCVDKASKGRRAWWVAPSYKMSEVGWRPLRNLAYKIPGADIRLGDRMVTLPGGGEVVVRSADNPQSLRGESLDFVVLDECAYMSEDAWIEALRPALADRKGGALFISTPKGLNWFHTIYQRGQDDGREWVSWRKPTRDNPFIDGREIDAARLALPERVYRQEFEAEFLSDGAYFENIVKCAVLQEPDKPEDHSGHSFVLSVDWGKHNDYSVFGVGCRECGRAVDWVRSNKIDYIYQREKLNSLYNRWKPVSVVPERNSMGEPNIELLVQSGWPVVRTDSGFGFYTSPTNKPPLIEGLAQAFILHDFRVPLAARDELQVYEVSIMPSGHTKFGAPEGMHDDWVMMLALLWWGMSNVPWLI